MPSPAATAASPALSPKSSPKSLSRMAPIAEEPQVDAQSAAQSATAAQSSSNGGGGAAGSGNEDGYDSASSTNSGSTGGRRSRNPGLTIDTVTASASNTPAAAAATTAQSPTSPASSSGTTSPTTATSPTGNGPMTPTTPLSDEVDFSLVYALHTFVATMEGQVAVVRNEPLILLDDSNSYWWLVKPLRSNTIGYIPAEIIETPYERLARVNQQKNVERALFRSNDIPGAPSKSTRPSLHPKTVVFPSDPRGDIFEYSPAVSDMSSGDEDEEDWDPENTKNPTEVAAVAGQDEDTIMDDATAQEEAVAHVHEEDAMDVDAPAPASTREEADEDELKPNPRRTSLGAGLLLRNRDQWSGDEEELPSDAADVEPQRAPSPEPSPTKATASSSPPTSPVKSSSRPAISSPTRPVASIPLDNTDANAADDADDDEDTSAPATATPAPTNASQPTRSASASEIDPITVLRIFPGTCAIPAESHQFKTVVVTKTMSVKELLHQALLKYRVFGPLASQHQGSNLDAMMADWYLTLSFTGAPTAGHHHVMNPDENVLGALEAVQKQAEDEAAALAAAQQQAEAAAATAAPPKRKSVLARFASKLYTPTLLASTKPSKHHLAKPILHVISPQDSGSIRLMLHQYSAMNMSPTRAATAAPTPLAATESSFNTSSSSSMSLVPGAFPAGPSSPPTSLSRNLSTGVSTLVRIELDHPTPAPASDSSLPPVRMAKTLKVDRVAPAAAVMEAALRKFSLAEGRNVGATPEYELVELASGKVCPASDPLPLPRDTMATFIMRKVAGNRAVRTTLTLAVTSPEKERPQSQVELRIPSPPSTKVQQQPQEVARADSGLVESQEASPGGTKRFSELLQEAQSLDLMQGLFDEQGNEVEVPSRDNAVEAK